MPLPIVWTPGLDAEMRRRRRSGESWDAIARVFAMSRNSALTRGGRLGLCRPRAGAPLLPFCEPEYGPADHGAGSGREAGRPDGARWADAPESIAARRSRRGDDAGAGEPGEADAEGRGAENRPPLPAGDALSWAVLTDGTLLEGSSYAGPAPERATAEAAAAAAPRGGA